MGYKAQISSINIRANELGLTDLKIFDQIDSFTNLKVFNVHLK